MELRCPSSDFSAFLLVYTHCGNVIIHHSLLQIVKLLQMITPTNDYEERVSTKFIKMVQAKLKQLRPSAALQEKLLIETGFRYSVVFPFVSSTVNLDAITMNSLPDNLRNFKHVKQL